MVDNNKNWSPLEKQLQIQGPSKTEANFKK